ncbi:MAG TPA: peptidase M28, partial [Blastocatellia bacterium]|nr:peptidase M28 [Blastocatellia bacterium]
MKKALFLVLTVVLLLPLSRPRAQTKTEDSSQKAPANRTANPQIQKIVREISAANIEATIKKLVSFGTRHSLSETESNERGIGAARRWIKSEFDRYSRESGG